MTRPEAVILDLDGLMIDTERVAREGWRQAAFELGHTVDEALLRRVKGRTPGDARRILMNALDEGFPYEEIRRRRDVHLREALERGDIEAMDGLPTLLAAIDRLGLRRAIATSGPRELTRLKLAALGLRARLDVVVCGDDIERGKPAPDIFLEAARRLEVDPSYCVVIEDSDPGARAADAAGMRVLVVPEYDKPAADVVALAWRVLPSLDAAADILVAGCSEME